MRHSWRGVGFVLPIEPPQVIDVAGATLFYAILDAGSLTGRLLGADVLGFTPEPEGFASGVSFAGAAPLTKVSCNRVSGSARTGGPHRPGRMAPVRESGHVLHRLRRPGGGGRAVPIFSPTLSGGRQVRPTVDIAARRLYLANCLHYKSSSLTR
jgi:hypothetical protein